MHRPFGIAGVAFSIRSRRVSVSIGGIVGYNNASVSKMLEPDAPALIRMRRRDFLQLYRVRQWRAIGELLVRVSLILVPYLNKRVCIRWRRGKPFCRQIAVQGPGRPSLGDLAQHIRPPLFLSRGLYAPRSGELQ